jgi:hypothetical protein
MTLPGGQPNGYRRLYPSWRSLFMPLRREKAGAETAQVEREAQWYRVKRNRILDPRVYSIEMTDLLQNSGAMNAHQSDRERKVPCLFL